MLSRDPAMEFERGETCRESDGLVQKAFGRETWRAGKQLHGLGSPT